MCRSTWRPAVFPVVVVLGAAAAQIVLAAQDRSNELAVSRRDYDNRQLLAPPPLSEAVLKGRTLWVQRCAYCHDGVGTPTYDTLGPWLDADTIRPGREGLVREKINTSSARMPGFQYALQPEQIDQLFAFLKTVTPDQKPTAAQKAKTPPAAAAEP